MYGKKLNLNSNGRLRLFKSLVQSLFTYGTITTSQSKAAAIKGMVDKIINLGKDKNIHLLQTYLTDKGLQKRLIEEIAPKLQNRISGYTSQVKIGIREGDRTTLVKMSLIGLENLKPQAVTKTKDRNGQSVGSTKSTKRENSRLSKTK